jgi:predicted Zn finger-like uncharacterized protein
MYTRCAHCETVFRVTPQQLQLSSGQVRCGRCQQVFDAFSTLSSQLPGSAAVPAPPSLTAVASPDETVVTVPLAQTVEKTEDVPRTAHSERTLHVDPAEEDEARDEDAGRFAPLESPPPFTALTLPEALFGAAPVVPQDRWRWLTASALLLLLALAQVAWFFPTGLAARLPGLRPALALYCGVLACDLGWARLPEQLFIEASDLQIVDPARPSEVLLTATVRNRAAVVQEFPFLELTLTGPANQTVARKVLRPADYAEAAELEHGIGANGEISIRLYLNTGQVHATGYRLYLFFI